MLNLKSYQGRSEKTNAGLLARCINTNKVFRKIVGSRKPAGADRKGDNV